LLISGKNDETTTERCCSTMPKGPPLISPRQNCRL